jgi:hypothetical protein
VVFSIERAKAETSSQRTSLSGIAGNLSQLRVFDTRRLERKIGFLEKEAFANIRKAPENCSDGVFTFSPRGDEAEANCT